MSDEKLYTLKEARWRLEELDCSRRGHPVHDVTPEGTWATMGMGPSGYCGPDPVGRGPAYCDCGAYRWLPEKVKSRDPGPA